MVSQKLVSARSLGSICTSGRPGARKCNTTHPGHRHQWRTSEMQLLVVDAAVGAGPDVAATDLAPAAAVGPAAAHEEGGKQWAHSGRLSGHVTAVWQAGEARQRSRCSQAGKRARWCSHAWHAALPDAVVPAMHRCLGDAVRMHLHPAAAEPPASQPGPAAGCGPAWQPPPCRHQACQGDIQSISTYSWSILAETMHACAAALLLLRDIGARHLDVGLRVGHDPDVVLRGE